jgi:tRNA(fMet)-specific endonuclease VapC
MIFIDTDILSFLLSGDKQVYEKLLKEVEEGKEIALTSINVYEVLKGLRYRQNRNKEMQFQKFLTYMMVYSLEDNVIVLAADIYANLREKGITISDSDILIAAIVINNSGILISNNTKHYQNIMNLTLENWKINQS